MKMKAILLCSIDVNYSNKNELFLYTYILQLIMTFHITVVVIRKLTYGDDCYIHDRLFFMCMSYFEPFYAII